MLDAAAWLKVKCLQRQEFVIGWWEDSDKCDRSLTGGYEGIPCVWHAADLADRI